MTRVRIRPEALHWREVEGEIVAIDVASREYLAVNRTGAALWPLLCEGTDPAALVAALLARFDVEPATAERDVEALLDDLRARRLVEEG